MYNPLAYFSPKELTGILIGGTFQRLSYGAGARTLASAGSVDGKPLTHSDTLAACDTQFRYEGLSGLAQSRDGPTATGVSEEETTVQVSGVDD